MYKILIILCGSMLLMAGNITLNISGIQSCRGEVYVALYKGPSNFLSSKAYKSIKLKAKKHLRYTFKYIPRGTYAVAIFHDKNKNAILDKNFLGIPKERIGISNNVSPIQIISAIQL